MFSLTTCLIVGGVTWLVLGMCSAYFNKARRPALSAEDQELVGKRQPMNETLWALVFVLTFPLYFSFFFLPQLILVLLLWCGHYMNAMILLGFYVYRNLLGTAHLGLHSKRKEWWLNFLNPMIVAYFDMTLQKDTADVRLDPDQPCLFGFHPHGIHGFYAHAITTNICGWDKLFPGVAPPRFTGADVIYKLPLMREFFLWQGHISVGRRSIQRALRAKQSVSVVVGGSQEVTHAQRGVKEEVLYLKKRRGFVRLALGEGVPLVPTYTFGLNDAYHQITWFQRIQQKLIHRFRFVIPLNYGVLGLQIPHRVSMSVVIGKPIPVPPVGEEVNEADIDAVLNQYVKAVTDLFERNKQKFGYGDRTLKII